MITGWLLYDVESVCHAVKDPSVTPGFSFAVCFSRNRGPPNRLFGFFITNGVFRLYGSTTKSSCHQVEKLFLKSDDQHMVVHLYDEYLSFALEQI